MTPEQIAIVRQSWAQVVPIAEQASQMFYGRLFEIDPTVRPLFRDVDMAAQGSKLTDMLNAAVNSLDKLESLLPAVEALGRRHIAYGVADAQFESVGAALLWTLEQGLGPAWSAEAADAWGTAYAVLSSVMRSAAKAEQAAVA